ncbi:hypothetical protein OH77DRAFT_544591 [Trametes cingulata]|nr:hypothetical protein OH77DRAFT_544591 [Trametes cingulata]
MQHVRNVLLAIFSNDVDVTTTPAPSVRQLPLRALTAACPLALSYAQPMARGAYHSDIETTRSPRDERTRQRSSRGGVVSLVRGRYSRVLSAGPRARRAVCIGYSHGGVRQIHTHQGCASMSLSTSKRYVTRLFSGHTREACAPAHDACLLRHKSVTVLSQRPAPQEKHPAFPGICQTHASKRGPPSSSPVRSQSLGSRARFHRTCTREATRGASDAELRTPRPPLCAFRARVPRRLCSNVRLGSVHVHVDARPWAHRGSWAPFLFTLPLCRGPRPRVASAEDVRSQRGVVPPDAAVVIMQKSRKRVLEHPALRPCVSIARAFASCEGKEQRACYSPIARRRTAAAIKEQGPFHF